MSLTQKQLDEIWEEANKVSPLTPRQQWLRRLLDETYDEDNSKWLSLKAIYDLYQTDLIKGDNVVYAEYDGKDGNEHNSSAFRQIRDDFQVLSVHYSTQGVYLSSNKGYKRANEEEALFYLAREDMFARMRFSRIHNKMARVDKDGQMRILLSKYQKDTYDPFKKVGEVNQ